MGKARLERDCAGPLRRFVNQRIGEVHFTQVTITPVTWSRSERDTLRAGARALGAAVELHSVTAPLEVLWQRIDERRAEDAPITRDQIEQWHRQFEVPTDNEMALYDRPLIEDVP